MGRHRGTVFSERSIRIVEMAAAGMAPAEITRELGCPRQAVHRVLQRQRPEYVVDAEREAVLDRLIRKAEAVVAGLRALRGQK